MAEITTFEISTPVVDSVSELFETMLSVEVEPGDPENLHNWDHPRIAGAVSFAGTIIGAVKVETTDDFARLMTAKMVGMEEAEIEGEDEIKDVILETCNIVAGSLKSSLNDSGLSCFISSPTLTMGRNFGIETLNMARYEKFAFCCQGHSFLVEVCLKLGEDAPPEALKKLTSVDITKFERLDIISSAGDTVIELFERMMSMNLELSESGSVEEIEGRKVVGSINFAGEVMGSLNLQVNDMFARIITSKMMDVPLAEIEGEEQLKDVIGELCNIVGGNIKSGFCDSGLKCEMSPPSITVGDDFRFETLNMARYEQFAFRFYDHDILVQVCVKIDENAKAPSDEKLDAASIDELMTEAKATADAGGASVEQGSPEAASDDSQVSQSDIDELLAQANAASVAEEGSHVESGAASASKEGPAAPKDSPPALPPVEEPGTGTHGQEEADLQVVSPNLDFILNIPVEIRVELGRTQMTMGKVNRLSPGTSVALSNVEDEDLAIYANNKLIARGSVVVDHEKYGIQVTEVISRMERIKSLRE
ncbi:MAG: chemotaxis protein CheX [Desulfobacteraceae bacterium]